MLETACVVDADGGVLLWHEPPRRSVVALPDSRDLWLVLFETRAILGGLAHSHPGVGPPTPSAEDLTTFAACEAGLGRRLSWWIATADTCVRYVHAGPGRLDYAPADLGPTPWLDELRARSYLHSPGG